MTRAPRSAGKKAVAADAQVAAASPAPPPSSLDMLDPRLRPLCDAYLAKAGAPGASVAIVATDRKYHLAYGVRVVDRPEPVTLATGFNIGSCSKAFVSATLASLVAEGLARWDDPLTRWVPEFRLRDAALTAQVSLRDACANRLGLPRIGFTEYGFLPGIPVKRILSGLRHTEPMHPLRDRFTYVNAGHTAAALAAGRITGLGFLPTLRQRLLVPLGMGATSGGAAALDEVSEQAGWHIRDGERIVPLPAHHTDNCLGSGGMVVSGADALQWLRLHLNGGRVDGVQLLPRDALAETHRPHAVATPGKDFASLFYPGARMGAYALGWAVSDFEGHPLVCHSGSDHGVTAMTVLLPRSGIGIAVYGNVWSSGIVALAYALAATLLGLAPRDWWAYLETAIPRPAPALVPQRAEPALPLARYAGRYQHPADGALQIELRDGVLCGNLPDGYAMNFTLEPRGKHRFAMRFTELPSRLSMAGWDLSFEASRGHGVAATMQQGSGPARLFGRR